MMDPDTPDKGRKYAHFGKLLRVRSTLLETRLVVECFPLGTCENHHRVGHLHRIGFVSQQDLTERSARGGWT